MNYEPQARGRFKRVKERKKGYIAMGNYYRNPHRSQTGRLNPAIVKQRRIVDEHPLVNRITSDNILAGAGRSVKKQAPASRWLQMVTSKYMVQNGWSL